MSKIIRQQNFLNRKFLVCSKVLFFIRCISLSVPSDTWKASGRASLTVSIPSLAERLCQISAPVSVSSPSGGALVVVKTGTLSWSGVHSLPSSESRIMHWQPDVLHRPVGQLQSQVWQSHAPYRNFPVVTVIFNIHRSAIWSVRIVNQDTWRYSLTSWTTRTTGRRSLCAVSYADSALFSDRYQYSTGFACLSGCYCNTTHPNCVSHPSVSTV